MTAYDLLNQLDESGHLKALYGAGLVTLRAYSARDLYTHYLALTALPRYIDAPADAVRAIVQEFGVCRATVYNAIKEMQQEVTL